MGVRDQMRKEKEAYIIWKKAQNVKLELSKEEIREQSYLRTRFKRIRKRRLPKDFSVRHRLNKKNRK